MSGSNPKFVQYFNILDLFFEDFKNQKFKNLWQTSNFDNF